MLVYRTTLRMKVSLRPVISPGMYTSFMRSLGGHSRQGLA
jgi:hypothetical protein